RSRWPSRLATELSSSSRPEHTRCGCLACSRIATHGITASRNERDPKRRRDLKSVSCDGPRGARDEAVRAGGKERPLGVARVRRASPVVAVPLERAPVDAPLQGRGCLRQSHAEAGVAHAIALTAAREALEDLEPARPDPRRRGLT